MNDRARTLALAGELRVLVGRLRRRARVEAPADGFTTAQAEVLGALDREGPATLTTLARAKNMRTQSMGETVASLKDAGMLRAAPDPADGRQTLLSLTPTAREKIRASRAAREDWLYRTLQTKLTPAEREQLAAAVDLLKRLVES